LARNYKIYQHRTQKKKKKQIFGLFPFILTIANLILKNYLHSVGFEKYF